MGCPYSKREVQMTKQARDVQVNGQSDSIIDAVLDADSVADAMVAFKRSQQ